MRRPILIAAAVILALAGSAFAAATPGDKSPYRKLIQRVRVLATHTIDAPNGMAETLDWATILEDGNAADPCNDSTFEVTRQIHVSHEDGPETANEAEDRPLGIITSKTDHRHNGGWWEPREIQLGKGEERNRIDIWGRDARHTTSRGGVHGV